MISLTANPRNVNEADFPAAGTPEEQWLFLLNYALLALSEYNTQPWRFRVQGDQVELSLDTSRRLPVVDPEDREMLISCGAACLNLRLAARHSGYQIWIEYLILKEQPEILPDVLVRLGLGPRQATAEDGRLFAVIPLRHTNRSVYEDRNVPEEIFAQLQLTTGAKRPPGIAISQRGAPVLAVLGTFSDTYSDWFNAGKALERVLLSACACGLQTSFVNQPIAVLSLRTRLGQILGRNDFPYLVLRMGYGKPSIMTPQRCVQDVLLEHT